MNICGIDEAGRGTAVGPMVIAGVALTGSVEGLTDSKKLTKQKRNALREKIIENSKYLILVYSNNDVDEMGISNIMKDSLTKIKEFFKDYDIVFDGNTTYGIEGIRTEVKADLTIQEVSAASILAKTEKDNILDELAKQYPNYSFEKHGGYLTKKHKEEIREFGLTDLHRKSYKIKGI